MNREKELVALLAILTVAAALRLGAPGADVTADPSSYAAVQDAFWYLDAAACAAEGVEVVPEPGYDPPVWLSLVRVWLSAVGSSLAHACLLSGLVSLGLLLATWRLVRAGLGPGPALAAAAVLATLAPQVSLSRVPLIYGPAALWVLAALALWLAGRGRATGPRLACELGAWAMVLLAADAIRPPVLAAGGGLLAGHLVRARASRPLLVGCALAGLVFGLLVVVEGRALLQPLVDLLGWFDPDRAAKLAYRLEVVHPSRDHGALPALLGALRFLGSGSGYLPLDPGACAVAALGALAIARRWSRLRPAAQETLAVLLGTAVAFGLGGLVMGDRPLRYFLLLGPTLATCAGCAVAWSWTAWRDGPPAQPAWRTRLAAALVGALAAPHAVEWALRPLSTIPTLVLAGLGAPLAILAAEVRFRPTREVARLVGVGLLGLACLGGLWSGLGQLLRPTWFTRDANRALRELVGPDARLAGPYVSSLAIGSGLPRQRASWIRSRPEPELEATLARLHSARVTHIVLGAEQEWRAALIDAFRTRGVELERVDTLRVGGPPPERTRAGRLPGVPVLVLRIKPFDGQ